MLEFSLAKYYKKNLESLLAVLKSKLDSWLTTVDSWWEKKQVSADAKKIILTHENLPDVLEWPICQILILMGKAKLVFYNVDLS